MHRESRGQDEACLASTLPRPGTGNIDQNPSFLPGDYHLQPGSPCIDTGTCDGAPTLDIEGNVRPAGAGCDMGAYEFGSAPSRPRFHHVDPNMSGTTDISDAISILGFLFLGDPPAISCKESADSNNDDKLDISDGVYPLNWLFTGGA